jgi:hypothetical protein
MVPARDMGILYSGDLIQAMIQQGNKRHPTSVHRGPLTELLLKDARWYNLDSFPAWQVWANDVEEVLTFLQAEGRLDVFLKDIKNLETPQHRDARLAEARGAFHFARNGFRIIQWEPPGEGQTKGEALICAKRVEPDVKSYMRANGLFLKFSEGAAKSQCLKKPKRALER